MLPLQYLHFRELLVPIASNFLLSTSVVRWFPSNQVTVLLLLLLLLLLLFLLLPLLLLLLLLLLSKQEVLLVLPLSGSLLLAQLGE